MQQQIKDLTAKLALEAVGATAKYIRSLSDADIVKLCFGNIESFGRAFGAASLGKSTSLKVKKKVRLENGSGENGAKVQPENGGLENGTPEEGPVFDESEDRVRAFVLANNGVAVSEVIAKLDISKVEATRHLRKLKEFGMIEMRGERRNARYVGVGAAHHLPTPEADGAPA